MNAFVFLKAQGESSDAGVIIFVFQGKADLLFHISRHSVQGSSAFPGEFCSSAILAAVCIYKCSMIL